MGRIMKTRVLTTLLGLAIVAIPAVAPASQPEVRLTDLKPELSMSAFDLALLLTDPRETAKLSIVLPSGFTVLEVINQDPFPTNG